MLNRGLAGLPSGSMQSHLQVLVIKVAGTNPDRNKAQRGLTLNTPDRKHRLGGLDTKHSDQELVV